MKHNLRALETYLPGLSLSRLINLGFYAGSSLLSRLARRPVVLNRPFILMVEPVSFCNLRCPLCPTGERALGRPGLTLSDERFREVIGSFLPSLWLVLLWNQGEPFLHPGLTGMIRFLKERRISVITSTNGNFRLSDREWAELVEAGPDEIIFSLDGLDEPTYLTYRVGGDWELLLGNIERLVSEKRRRRRVRPRVHIQFLAMKDNQDQIPGFVDFARKLGADTVSLKTVQVFDADQAERFLPGDPGLSRYPAAARVDEATISVKPPVFCSRLWTGPVLLADGRLTVCCFDRSGRYCFATGDGDGSGSPRWRGGELGGLRRRLLRGEGGLPICANCTAGLPSPYVWKEVLR